MTPPLAAHRVSAIVFAAFITVSPLAPACVDGGDDGSGDDVGTGDGDGDKPDLGSTPNVEFEAALSDLEDLEAQAYAAIPDASAASSSYVDAALQQLVQRVGALTGRVENGLLTDDAAILESLGAGTPEDIVDAYRRALLAVSLLIRQDITQVAAALPDPARDPALLYASWDEAWLWWDAALRPMAADADAYNLERNWNYGGLEEEIEAAFIEGHEAIEGPIEVWAIDDFRLGPAKQRIEKTTFVVHHRLLLSSASAASQGDTVAARDARGHFMQLEDRMEGRNTPGIEIVYQMLEGPPAAIDVAVIEHELAIAFAKRTRKYCDHALPDVDATLGTAAGLTGAIEGRTYATLIVPHMAATLDGFDAQAFLATWDRWIEAVRAEDNAAAATESETLVAQVCNYQSALGIEICTASEDEAPMP